MTDDTDLVDEMHGGGYVVNAIYHLPTMLLDGQPDDDGLLECLEECGHSVLEDMTRDLEQGETSTYHIARENGLVPDWVVVVYRGMHGDLGMGATYDEAVRAGMAALAVQS